MKKFNCINIVYKIYFLPWITEVRRKYAFVLSFTGKYFSSGLHCVQISILIHLFSLDELISASSSLFVNAFIFLSSFVKNIL